MEKLVFEAEVKQVNARKLANLDVKYRVLLETNDPSVLALGVLSGDTGVKVSVEVPE